MVATHRGPDGHTPKVRLLMPLLVCATPIGNLADITARVLDALRAVDLIICEDTRRTRGLLTHYGIQSELLSFDQHQEERRTSQILPMLAEGRTLALVSDAGLPGLNDPGARLIAAARQADHDVTVLPGPTAVEAALISSGFASERFTFVGYLPRRESERCELWRETTGWDWPVVAFESPRRLGGSLASLAAFDADRRVAVCRELTKLHEEVVLGTAAELADRYEQAPKGEITVVFDTPRPVVEPDRRAAALAVAELAELGVSRRKAAGLVGELAGLGANELYGESLNL